MHEWGGGLLHTNKLLSMISYSQQVISSGLNQPIRSQQGYLQPPPNMLIYLHLQKIDSIELFNSERTIRWLTGRVKYFPLLKISATLTLPLGLGKILFKDLFLNFHFFQKNWRKLYVYSYNLFYGSCNLFYSLADNH